VTENMDNLVSGLERLGEAAKQDKFMERFHLDSM
jgi:hypothetical protein